MRKVHPWKSNLTEPHTYGLFPEGIICCSSLPQGLGCLTGLNTHQYPSGLSELASRATTLPTNVSRGGRGKRRDQVLFEKPSLLFTCKSFGGSSFFLQKIAWSCFDGDIRMGWWNCIEGYLRNSTIGPIGTFLPEFRWGNDKIHRQCNFNSDRS